MLWKKLAVVIIALVLLVSGCSALPFSLDENEIKSITIGDSVTLNNEDIKEFAIVFNRSKRYRDDASTTHPIITTINMDDGSVIKVWSGTQGFLTTAKDDVQYNIRNEKLEDYIDSFVAKDE